MDTTNCNACDLSEYGTLRIAGASASLFVQTMFTGSLEPLGTLFGYSCGLLVNGQGEVIDTVGVMRTGDDEYLMLTTPGNSEECLEWLQAHLEIEDSGERVFADTVVEDQSSLIAVLALYGAGAPAVFASLQKACGDQVLFMAAQPDEGAYGIPMDPSYLLFVPINLASQIGDFLQSCLNLEVVDYEAFVAAAAQANRYNLMLQAPEYHTPAQLGVEHLLRPEHDFVGAKALFSQD